MRMIAVAPNITLNEDELHWQFIRASGPGGQNVNKVATAVQLRFNVLQSSSLPEEVRERLLRQQAHRLTTEGELVIEAKRFRSQERNRQDALKRLLALILLATVKPKVRVPTRPTLASKQRKRVEKQRQSEIKRGRGRVSNGN